MASNRTKEKLNKIKIVLIFAVIAIFLCSIKFQDKFAEFLKATTVSYNKNEVKIEQIVSSQYRVHYINVGQGNSSLIEFPDGKTMLIDAGDTMYGQTVVDYISKFNISKIDYLVATHSDSDHIGGMNKVFEAFEIKNIYRPFQISGTYTKDESNNTVFEPYEHEDLVEVYNYYKDIWQNKLSRVKTDVYKTFIRCVYGETYYDEGETKESTVTVFYDGLKISGEGYEVEFFAPLKRSENLDLSTMSNTLGYATVGYGVSNNNDNSPMMLVQIENEKFFYTGDATWKQDANDTSVKHAEQDFVNSLTDEEKLKFKDITVYLAGHHGSKYSSGEDLVGVISSKFVVISVGQNDYGHPSSEAIRRFEENFENLEEDYLLRTDKCGSIVFGCTTDGVRYCLEKTEEQNKLEISPIVISAIICGGLIVLILSIKSINIVEKRSKKRR